MTPSQSKALINQLKAKGWKQKGNVLHNPTEARLLESHEPSKKSPRTKHHKTGWIDDTRNIANKSNQVDAFVRLVAQELKLQVWPEFYFSMERNYRFDYAIPITPNSVQLKIAIEVEGGIWAKGNSGHSSGKGIKRDMDKASLAASLGWLLIRRTPDQLLTNETLELIKRAVEQRNHPSYR